MNILKMIFCTFACVASVLAHASPSLRTPCEQCHKGSAHFPAEPKLFVFISFSMPETTLLELSAQLEKVGGVFVVRGIPENSFQCFAERVYDLKEKGLNTPIQIHPQLFQEFQVTQTPTFVVKDASHFDKISGNFSLSFALETMEQEGETQAAKALSKALRWRPALMQKGQL